jgi:hypothetical protein
VNATDISRFYSVDFSVKGYRGNEQMMLKVVDGDRAYNTSAATVLYSDMTTQWQRVSVPFSDFQGLNKTNISQIAFSFGKSAFGSDPLNQVPAVIYIDGYLCAARRQ